MGVSAPRTAEAAARTRLEPLGLRLDEYVEASRGIAIATPMQRFSLTRLVQQLLVAGLDVEPELMRRAELRSFLQIPTLPASGISTTRGTMSTLPTAPGLSRPLPPPTAGRPMRGIPPPAHRT